MWGRAFCGSFALSVTPSVEHTPEGRATYLVVHVQHWWPEPALSLSGSLFNRTPSKG